MAYSERIPKNNHLLEKARKLRREMTPQENHLWYDFLRKYPVKIYKQRIIDNYIADFYCASAKIVIELDGNQHFTDDRQQYDQYRNRLMELMGLKVLRFPNSQIDNHFDAVCKIIDYEIRTRLPDYIPPRE